MHYVYVCTSLAHSSIIRLIPFGIYMSCREETGRYKIAGGAYLGGGGDIRCGAGRAYFRAFGFSFPGSSYHGGESRAEHQSLAGF